MKRLHPILYAVVALVAVSAALANVVSAFSSAPPGVDVFVADAAEPETIVIDGSGTSVPELPRLIDIPSAETLAAPIVDAASRVTKKPFGIEIHPATSPVPGDKFDGFHVGVDFETFADERDIDVPVTAACEGPLLFKQWAKGYGGVAAQRCNLEGKGVVVIYGHLKIDSVTAASGKTLRRGDRVGVLGADHSQETDGVRKHLHFGVHESATTTDIRGYVKTEEETAGWLDALEYMTP